MNLRIALLGATLFSPLSFGAVLPIHDKSELSLGRGVNSLTEQPYEECVVYDTEKFEDGSSSLNPGDFTASSLPVKIEQITTYEQMSKYSSMAISASVSYSFASGSMAYASAEGMSMFSDQASVGMDISADYGRWFLTNVRIKPEYATLPREEFYKRCGREYVAGYRLGQGIRVKMSVSASATSSYSQMSAAVSAAVSAGGFGGSAAASFSQAASSLLSASSLQVDMQSYGSGDLRGVSSIIRTESDATKFRDTISQYIGALEPKKAVRTHYITRAYFSDDGDHDPILIEVKRRTVQSLYSDFLMLMSNKDRIDAATRGGRLRQFLGDICEKKPKECDAYLDKMEKEREWITAKAEEIRNLSNSCIHAKAVPDCKTFPEVHIMLERLQSILWPRHYRYQLMQAYLDEIRRR